MIWIPVLSIFFAICSICLELEAAISTVVLTFWSSDLSLSKVFATFWCSNRSCCMVPGSFSLFRVGLGLVLVFFKGWFRACLGLVLGLFRFGLASIYIYVGLV